MNFYKRWLSVHEKRVFVVKRWSVNHANTPYAYMCVLDRAINKHEENPINGSSKLITFDYSTAIQTDLILVQYS